MRVSFYLGGFGLKCIPQRPDEDALASALDTLQEPLGLKIDGTNTQLWPQSLEEDATMSMEHLTLSRLLALIELLLADVC